MNITLYKGVITMSNEAMTLYRLIILHMLSKVSHPLSSAQIADFILYKEYTNFMTLQQVLTDLTEDSFITAATMGNRTLYTITEEGRRTLSFFDNRLQDSIKADINEYLEAHEIQIRDELSILTNYDKNTSGEYVAELIARDQDNELVHISITVPTADFAQNVCQKWKEKNQEIYQYLIRELF